MDNINYCIAAICSASAAMAASSPAALFTGIFIRRIANAFSTHVGGPVWMWRSWAAGRGSSNGDEPLLLLSRELKRSFHSASYSTSLVGRVPSLFLTLTLDFLPLPERLWMIFHVQCSCIVAL